jgi:hypothetical protein
MVDGESDAQDYSEAFRGRFAKPTELNATIKQARSNEILHGALAWAMLTLLVAGFLVHTFEWLLWPISAGLLCAFTGIVLITASVREIARLRVKPTESKRLQRKLYIASPFTLFVAVSLAVLAAIVVEREASFDHFHFLSLVIAYSYIINRIRFEANLAVLEDRLDPRPFEERPIQPHHSTSRSGRPTET